MPPYSEHEQSPRPTDEYDAFVSYATTPDYAIARRLESFLESFHKLENPGLLDLRPLKICVDGSDFKTIPEVDSNGANPSTGGISELLVNYLSRSRRLIVLCSRAARHSRYLNFEITWFLEHRGADAILLVVTDGQDPSSDPSSVFPLPILEWRINERPWYDLRQYKGRESRKWAKVRSAEDSLVSLAANLSGYSAGEVQPIWFREQRRRRRRGIVTAGIVLTCLLVLTAVTIWQSRIALDQRRLAFARRLSAQGQALMQQSAPLHTLGLLLAIESLRSDPSIEADQTIRYGLAAMPKVLFTTGKTHGILWSSALNDDGLLITSDLDDITRVWNTLSGKEVCSAKTRYVSQVILSRDSQTFFTYGQDGSANRSAILEAWVTSSCRRAWSGRIAGVLSSLKFDSQGRRLIAITDNGVQILDPRSGLRVERGYPKGPVCDAAFVYEKNIVATLRCNSGVEISEADHPDRRIAFVPGKFKSLSVSPDGAQLALATGNRVLVRMLRTPGLPLMEFSHPFPVERLHFCADGERIATSSFDSYARLWKGHLGSEGSLVALPTVEDFGTFSADCKFISATNEQIAWVFEARARGESAFISFAPSESTGFLDEAAGFSAQLGKDHSWRVTEGSSARVVARLKAGVFDPTVVSSAHDEFQATSTRNSSEVEIRDGRSLALLTRLNHKFATQAMSFDPSGHRLGILDMKGDLSLWDWQERREVFRKPLHESCNDLSFSGDGNFLAIGCDSGRIAIMDAETGAGVKEWSQKDAVMSIAFHPSESLLIIGGMDGVARIVNSQSGRELSHVTTKEPVIGVGFSDTLPYAVTLSGGDSGGIRFWLWRAEDLISEACSRLTRNLTMDEWHTYMGSRKYRATCPSIPE
jgi:WD40 repeat protein